MKRLALMLSLSAAALVGGCDDDNTTTDLSQIQDLSATPRDMTIGGGGDGGGGFPTAPTLGAQIDRMGRAGVNTALTAPFYDPAMAAQKTAHEMAQDQYNQAPPSMWSTFVPEIAGNLPVYDAIDGTCGNQPLAATGPVDGGPTAAYGTLATVLSDDELYLDTSVATCDPTKNYLAVEVGFITKTTPASCGGRTPLDNVIDVTYAVLSGGLISGVPVINGVTADADAIKANNTSFPFLGAPN